MLKKISLTLLGIFLIYGAVGVAIKCGIGVLPVDAAITTLSNIIHIKVGTVAIIFHGSFLVGQIILEKKNFRKIEFLQIINITFGGVVLNFVLYTLLKNFTVDFYPWKLLFSVLAFLVGAFGCTLVLETHFVRTSMEGFIQLMAERMGITMGTLRRRIDIFLVIITVILILVTKTGWTLREGTVIAALIFGPAMDFFKEKIWKGNGVKKSS
ncbi:MAG: hypothetical protein J5988_08730 [Eubacterium sp.]|nr:hypothetical protein [Eubacterium sp.]